MPDILDKESHAKFFRGYTIYDCAIHTADIWFFVLVEEKEDREVLPRTRFITVGAQRPIENRFAVFSDGKFSFTSCACNYDSEIFPKREFVAVDTRGNVYSADAQRKGDEESMHDVSEEMKSPGGARIVISKVVRVAGQVYALGSYRKVFRRLGMNQWVELGVEGKGATLPKDAATDRMLDLRIGFRDMSGFSSDDMYAVGGDGDAWRFDGKTWKQCPLPTNNLLSTVCCAGDGNVYIGELNGTLWVGREDKWKRAAKADIAPGFGPVDSVWFNNRLYLGGQEGLWTYDAKSKSVRPLGEVETDAPNPTNGGRLDLSPDGKHLLTAGPYGACLNDGSGWRRLFNAFDFL